MSERTGTGPARDRLTRAPGLLAAIPDLLVAAKEAVALLEGAYDDEWGACDRVHELLHGAIDRAEGRR